MKKILITALIVLLIILAYFAIFNGISFGKVKILSVEQIIQANDQLTNDIESVNALLKKDYPSKKDELSKAVQTLTEKKEEYFDMAKVSTEGEITKANTEETYLIEYLWTRVGRHATSKGVTIRMDVNTGSDAGDNMKNLAFTVKGAYTSIIQFISELENDDKLNFRIENFKMTKSDTQLTATFNVNNVRIKPESSTTAVVSGEESSSTGTSNNAPAQTVQNTDNANTAANNNGTAVITENVQP